MKRFAFIFLLSSEFLFSQSTNQKCLTHFIVSSTEKKSANANLNFKIVDKPQLQTFKISKSGFFKIHFDTTNINNNLPSLVDFTGNSIPNSYKNYIDSVSFIFDYVLENECTINKFSQPPKNNFYEVFIVNQPDGIFGYTDLEQNIYIQSDTSHKKYFTFIVVDNDFGIGYRTKGIDALKATCAHEFFHAIQIGNYGIWEEEFYFYELIAESFEKIIFPNVKDYLFDLKIYFDDISSISLFQKEFYPGYERAIWGVYLKNKFGIEFLKSWWDDVEEYLPSVALKNNLRKYNSTLEREFTNFSFLNLKASKFKEDNFYDDGFNFPYLNYTETIIFQNNSLINRTSNPFTSHFYLIKNGVDSSFVLISNLNKSNNFTPKAYSLFLESNNYKLQNVDFNFWNITTLNDFGENKKIFSSVYPNPFKPSISQLNFPLVNESDNLATLEIYNSLFENIFSNTLSVNQFTGKKFISWNGIDLNEKIISSGVYYYKIKTTKNNYEGKFAVIK